MAARGGRPRVVLISTYDLGRQPFGLASPAAWLARAGYEVVCNDLAIHALDEEAVRGAALVAFHLPMHTATRLAVRALDRVRRVRPDVPVAFYGLYAGINAAWLRSLGAVAALGGEFEAALVRLAGRVTAGLPDDGVPDTALERLEYIVPDRGGLPPLERYARLQADGEERLVGATESTRGCLHHCRHCPVVPVYGGRFRAIPREVVLQDVRRLVEAGARHITFGDPDFWNGIGHAMPLVRELHRLHPGLSYDVTIKVEHLLRHAAQLPALRETGCAFVTSAIESVDDAVLARLDKGHTRADFVALTGLMRDAGLVLHPTFVAFTPWITVAGYQDLLATIAELGLVGHVAPVQLALRLLIPAGSRLLELSEVRDLVGPFEAASLVHPWRHPEPEVDRLQGALQAHVEGAVARGVPRAALFASIWEIAASWPGAGPGRMDPVGLAAPRVPVPFLTEPWYC